MSQSSITLPSPLGCLLLLASNNQLVRLSVGEGDLHGKQGTEESMPVLYKGREWLLAYFAGHNPPIDPSWLAPMGTAFQRAVWDIVLRIPYGRLASYGDIAQGYCARTGTKGHFARAVGGAIHNNPLPIIIPCHRVVAQTGLGGYGLGLPKKRALLHLEGIEEKSLAAHRLSKTDTASLLCTNQFPHPIKGCGLEEMTRQVDALGY